MRKKLLSAAAVLLLLTLGTVGYYAYSFYDFANNIHKNTDESRYYSKRPETKNPEATSPPKWEGKERVNIMLLGTDSRDGELARTDTMMIASIDPVTKKAALFSLLRDTYVKIPGHGSDKINAAFVYGGPELAMQTASELTGLKIQYYVHTDFQGFIELVDAIGGIELEVEKDMKYSDSADGHQYDIDLKQGLQHLDGEKALQYVRFRHDKLSDYARTERQRKFMTAVAEKMTTTSSLLKLPSILRSIHPYIETNMTLMDMIKLGALAYEVKANEVATEQLPPSSLLQEKRLNNGMQVIVVDSDKLQQYISDLFAEQLKEPETETADGTGETPGGKTADVANRPNNGTEVR